MKRKYKKKIQGREKRWETCGLCQKNIGIIFLDVVRDVF